MRKIKYIILNGPRSSGKTTIARELTRELAVIEGANGVVQDSFAAPLRHFFAVAFGDKYLGMNKELSRSELQGRSIREAQMELEQSMKKKYGEDCFARWLVHRTLRRPERLPVYVIVDDGKCDAELGAFSNPFVVKVFKSPMDTGHYNVESSFKFYNTGTIIDLIMNTRTLAKKVRETVDAY